MSRQSEILELFAEAQHLGRNTEHYGYATDPWLDSIRNRTPPQERAKQKHARLQRIDSGLKRSRAALRAALRATGPAVDTAVCPRCGATVERREGLSRWQHVGTPWGRCKSVV